MKRISSFLMGTILGALVGAAIAILLAPASGDELRTQLQQRVGSLQSELKAAASARRIELEKQLSNLRQSPPPSSES